MNMVKKEYLAFSIKDAITAAEADGFTVYKDKTIAWKNAGSPISDEDLKTFANEIFEKDHLVNAPGVGFVITVAKGSADKRERPYVYENVVHSGKTEKTRCYEVRKDSDDSLVTRLSGPEANKGAAVRAMKEAMTTVKEDMYVEVVWRVPNGNNILGRAYYTPSINTKQGRYVLIANDIVGTF